MPSIVVLRCRELVKGNCWLCEYADEGIGRDHFFDFGMPHGPVLDCFLFMLLWTTCSAAFHQVYTLGNSFAKIERARGIAVRRPYSRSLTTMSASSISVMTIPTIPLRNGQNHPAIGFGTYKVGYMPPSASAATTTTTNHRPAGEVIQDALKAGYRCFECAEFYGNEADLGKAFQSVKREELFIISKVWTTTMEKGQVREQLEKTLAALQTDYLDLYMIHWPVPKHHIEAYKVLLQLRDEGKIRGVGVSNYAWEDYCELRDELKLSENDLPLVNQIEINPFLYRSNTISKFQADGVVLQAYRSLRDGKAMDHPVLVKLAQHYGCSVPQLLGRWCVQKGFVYFPKSVQYNRMVENKAVFEFAINEEDMATLDGLTTPENLDNFQALYRKCVNRDTSKDGTMEGVKMDITID
jgi:diketogulonate reductase-like aldo/keto reductase